MTALAIPTALDVLRTQLREHGSVEDIALPLRALQMRGITKQALVVQIERARATNQITAEDDAFEDSCLLALDLINGDIPGLSLVWDAAHEAASLLPRSLSADDLNAARRFSIEPSDLLPPRTPLFDPDSEILGSMSASVFEAMSRFDRVPDRADFFRAPKGVFTTRPAALLTFDDHLILEGLASFVEHHLITALPRSVVWPRRRLQPPAMAEMSEIIQSWESPYIAKADIAAFYENVDHALLAVFLVGKLGIEVQRARAVESLLTAVMGSTRGLPQGPAASEVLASSFLLGIDTTLEDAGVDFVRYADDYFFPVVSLAEGRQVLQNLESLLTDIGLSLNSAKTQVMRWETYLRGLQRPSPAVEELKERITRRRIRSLSEMEEADDLVDILKEAGVDEEMLFDVFYHETASLEDALQQARDRIGPSFDETYHIYFTRIARMLKSGNLEGEPATLSSLARECLLVLMSSQREIRPVDLEQVLTWFPALAPLISDYLTARSDHASPATTAFVRRWLRNPTQIDWFDAWMCRTAGAPQLIRSKRILRDLRIILRDDNTLPLTRLESARSLAKGRALSADEWRSTFVALSMPLRSEMFFTAITSIDEYPWMLKSLTGVADEAQESLMRSLPELDAPLR